MIPGCFYVSITSCVNDLLAHDLRARLPVTSELADRRASMSSELVYPCVSMSSELGERCVSMSSELGDLRQ